MEHKIDTTIKPILFIQIPQGTKSESGIELDKMLSNLRLYLDQYYVVLYVDSTADQVKFSLLHGTEIDPTELDILSDEIKLHITEQLGTKLIIDE